MNVADLKAFLMPHQKEAHLARFHTAPANHSRWRNCLFLFVTVPFLFLSAPHALAQAPSGITITGEPGGTTLGSAIIRWNIGTPNGTITEIRIRWSVEGSNTWTAVDSDDDPQLSASSTGMYTATSLDSTQQYIAQIRARNAAGITALSAHSGANQAAKTRDRAVMTTNPPRLA